MTDLWPHPVSIASGPAHRFAVTLVGGVARRVLGPGRAGRVLAVFRRSFYFEDEAGGLACLGHPRIGAGPLNGLVDMPEPWEWAAAGLRPGDHAEVRGSALCIDGKVSITLRDSVPWRPQPPPVDWTRADLAKGLELLAAEARRRAPAEGLGRLIPYLAGGRSEAPATAPNTLILTSAWPAMRQLSDWLRQPPPAGIGSVSPAAVARGLLGLGPGLTPSGDDLIGGALIALRALGADAAARGLAQCALQLAPERTGRISRAHLAAAAEGEAAAALHETLAAVLGGDTAGLGAHLDDIGAIGHCSGWDALAGATIVLAWRAS